MDEYVSSTTYFVCPTMLAPCVLPSCVPVGYWERTIYEFQTDADVRPVSPTGVLMESVEAPVVSDSTPDSTVVETRRLTIQDRMRRRCLDCHEWCVNPVELTCKHRFCRLCLDTVVIQECPHCYKSFNSSDYRYLNQFLGPDYYEFLNIVGKYGRGRGVRYAIKWYDGSITGEPAGNIPAKDRLAYLKKRNARRRRV